MTDINNIKELKRTDIKIEKIGSWFWVTGNTFVIKEQLKELGFFYSGNKKAWFYNSSSVKGHRAFYKDINELRLKFNSEVV